MRLARPAKALPIISIIPLVDVLLILLVFFMVTSTFLDLDMIPLSKQQDAAVGAPQEPGARTLLARIVPGGDLIAAGRRVPADAISSYFTAERESLTRLQLLLMPSPRADVQALVRVLDAAAQAGVTNIQVIRFGEGG